MSTADAEKPADEPKSLLDKLGAALPVALTAIATAFAGMSTSELQRAMFWRSAAAQDQARATNQWTLAGFKRDRSLIVQTTAAQLRAASGYAKASFTFAAPPGSDADRAAKWLLGEGPPPVSLPDVGDEPLLALLKAIRDREPEAEILKKAARLPMDRISKAIDAAEEAVRRTDDDWDPLVKAAGKIVAAQADVKADAPDRAGRLANATAAQAAGFELESRRYRAEATLNQGIGFLYEARVKVSTAESDRHRVRSENFFYAMLAAQVGATVASLALARRRKSALWALAGLSGLVAVAIGAYVYVTI